jgi:hypothetical protein
MPLAQPKVLQDRPGGKPQMTIYERVPMHPRRATASGLRAGACRGNRFGERYRYREHPPGPGWKRSRNGKRASLPLTFRAAKRTDGARNRRGQWTRSPLQGQVVGTRPWRLSRAVLVTLCALATEYAKPERALTEQARPPEPQVLPDRAAREGAHSRRPRVRTQQCSPIPRSGGCALRSNAKSAVPCPRTGRREDRRCALTSPWTALSNPSPTPAPRRHRRARACRQTALKCAPLQRTPANRSVKWATRGEARGRRL